MSKTALYAQKRSPTTCCLYCVCLKEKERRIQREAESMHEWVRPLFQKIWPEPRTSWKHLCNSALTNSAMTLQWKLGSCIRVFLHFHHKCGIYRCGSAHRRVDVTQCIVLRAMKNFASLSICILYNIAPFLHDRSSSKSTKTPLYVELQLFS